MLRTFSTRCDFLVVSDLETKARKAETCRMPTAPFGKRSFAVEMKRECCTESEGFILAQAMQ